MPERRYACQPSDCTPSVNTSSRTLLVEAGARHCPFTRAVSGHVYALAFVGVYSKGPETRVTFVGTSQTVKHFLTAALSREGYPGDVLMGHGPQFMSAAFKYSRIKYRMSVS